MSQEELGAMRVSLGLNDSGFRRGVTEINRMMRVMDSQFNAVRSTSADFDKSMEGMQATSTHLSNKLKAQKEKVAELNRQYQESVRTKGADAKETQNLLIRYNKTLTAMNKMEGQLKSTNRNIQDQASGWKQLQDSTSKSVDGINQRMKLLQARYQATASGIDGLNTSTKGLQVQTDNLSNTLDLQRKTMQTLRTAYEKTIQIKGEDSEETRQAELAYQKSVATMRKTEQQLQTMRQKLTESKSGWNELSQATTDAVKTSDTQMKILEARFRTTMASVDNFGEETDHLRQKSNHLSEVLDEQGKKVEALRNQYQESIRIKGRDAQATKEAELAYQNALGTLRRTQTELDHLNADIREQENNWNRLSNSLNGVGDRVGNVAERFQNVGGMLSGASLPLIGFGVLAGKTANDFESAQGRIQAKLGTTKKTSEELGIVAQKLWKKGFGENLGEVSDGVSTVTQMMQDLTQDGIAGATEKALILSRTFNYDVNESVRASKALMDNFGVSSGKAFDYITVAAQKGGDYSQELLDTISEYSVQFAEAGFSVDGMFNVLIQGAQNGAWNLDKVGDAVKEFNIRAKDGSDTTAEGFKMIGLNAEDMAQKIAQGGESGQRAFMATVAAISNIEDPVKRGQAGVALFGTQFEDLEDKVVSSLNPTTDMLGKVEGATQKAGKAITDNFGDRAKKTWRGLQEDLIPLGDRVLELAEEYIPKLASGASDLLDKFDAMSPTAQKVAIGIGAIGAVIGPVLGGIGFMVQGIGGLVKAGGSVVRTFGAGGAAEGATASLGNFLKVGSRVTGWAGLAALGIYEIGKAGVSLYKHMNESAIPSISLFNDKVSESTQKSVTSFLKLRDDATMALNELNFSGQAVTQDMANKIIGKFDTMNSTILTKMQERHTKQLEQTKTFFANSSALSDTEEAAALSKMQSQNIQKQVKQQEYQNAIKSIMTTASKEKRALTDSEQKEINRIQGLMTQNGIQTLSKNEVESKVIMERMKANASALTAQQAAQVVQNSLKQKNESVKHANDQYNKTVANIIRMRDETGVISADQAKKLIAEAEKTRKNSIDKATDMHNQVVGQAKKQAGEHVNQVDWTTGQVKTKWQAMKDDAVGKAKEMRDGVANWWSKFKSDVSKHYGNMVDESKTQLNKMIDMVNDIAGHLGISKKIPKLSTSSGKGSAIGKVASIGKIVTSTVKKYSKNYAAGTNYHPGGDALVGEKGWEYAHVPGQGVMKVGVQGPEVLKNFKRGSSVLPHKQSVSLEKNMKMPGYANGIGDYFDWAMDGASSLVDKALNKVGIKGISLPGFFSNFGSAIFNTTKDGIVTYTQSLLDQIGFGGGGGYSFSSAFRKTSNFGMRNGKPHKGIDLAARAGTPIPSQSAGPVIYSGFGKRGSGYGGYGNVVHIGSKAGLSYLYGHNTKNYVKTGDSVSKGQIIGTVGNTGDSRGNHLHFEIRQGNKPVDPDSFGGSFSGGGNAPGNVRAWIMSAIKATGAPMSWLSALTTIAMKESNGNPKAYNGWDINAKRGIASRG